MSRFVPIAAILALSACDGPQSALSPAGRDAELLADLFWIMLAGAVVLWLLVNGLFFFITRINTQKFSRRWAEALIIGGGVLFPTIVLAVLLSYSLSLMPAARAGGDGLRVRVYGEQWWWRVEYLPQGASEPIVSANEVRLPAGQRTEILLASDTVIHSFWIPSLGGKTDMFPGRETRMSLEPTVPGIYRGQCAEFCGASHALMAFETVVLEPDAFSEWLEHAASDAVPPEGELARAGAALFAAEGCGACHTIRGTEARGKVGPDLTHVGSRLSVGAGILPNEPEDFAHWVADTEAIKPGVEMPSYGHLDADALLALGHYLESLQ